MVQLSIIIPTYNRSASLKRCLESLAHQRQAPSDFEVIVVVDGSTDGTEAMLQAFQSPYRLQVVVQPNAGQAAARNHGLRQARGRYCLFLDDDMLASPDLVAAHLRGHTSQERAVALGRILLDLPSGAGWFARSFAGGWHYHYGALDAGTTAPGWEDCYSGNMSVEREGLLAAGGFAEDLQRGEDVELGYRLKQQGFRFIYLPDAASRQDERKGFTELVRDAEAGGAASARLLERYPAMLPRIAGSYQSQDLRKRLLRHLLLALNVPPRLLKLAGNLIPHTGWRDIWGRFLHSYCYWRGLRRSVRSRERWRQLRAGTPILMYHAFGRGDEPASRYVVPVRRFAWQMLLLKALGYHVLSLAGYVRYLQRGWLPPPRSVVITIDDGYACTGRLALPILRHFNFPATLFVVSDRVGGVNDWDGQGELASRPLLTWEQIAELVDHGIDIGAHTRCHQTLPGRSCRQIRQELAGSRDRLRARLNVPVSLFAYPYGEYDPIVQWAVARVGFAAGCTVDGGLNTPATSPYALRRVEIQGTDSLFHFLFALWFGERRPTLYHRREAIDAPA